MPTAGERAQAVRGDSGVEAEEGEIDEIAAARKQGSGADFLEQAEDAYVWLATTTSATTIVLVLLQVLWIKAHWTDVWR